MKDKIKVILYLDANLDYIVDEFQTRDPVKLLAASLRYLEELAEYTAHHNEYLRICAALDTDIVQVLQRFIEDYTNQLLGVFPIRNNPNSDHMRSLVCIAHANGIAHIRRKCILALDESRKV